DELEPDAISQFLATASQHLDAVIIYSDEDHYDEKREYMQPLLKPDLAPESFFHQPLLIGNTAALNCQRIQELGGFHPAYEGTLFSEIFHRALAKGYEIRHVRRVLIHHRLNQPFCHGQRLVQERLVDTYRQDVTTALPKSNPFITIIIPSA